MEVDSNSYSRVIKFVLAGAGFTSMALFINSKIRSIKEKQAAIQTIAERKKREVYARLDDAAKFPEVGEEIVQKLENLSVCDLIEEMKQGTLTSE
jgi:hypothetical protein